MSKVIAKRISSSTRTKFHPNIIYWDRWQKTHEPLTPKARNWTFSYIQIRLQLSNFQKIGASTEPLEAADSDVI